MPAHEHPSPRDEDVSSAEEEEEEVMIREEDIPQLSYRELQAFCKQFGEPSAGKRSDLEARLRAVLADADEAEEDAEEDAEEEDEEEEEENFDNLKELEEVDESDDDEEDEEDDEDDEEEEEVVEPEILGMLVRSAEPNESGDNVYFISADDFEKEWNAADRGANADEDGEGDESESEDEDEAVLEYGDDEEANDEEDDHLFGVSTTKWNNVARNVTNGLAFFEFFTFVVLLCGVLQEAQKVGESGSDHTVRTDAVYDEPRTLAEALYVALLTHAFTLKFWSTVLYYSAVFYALPTVVGLIFGAYWSPESVFVFSLARYSLYYLLYGSTIVFTWAAFPFQERVFTVTCAVSFLMAFWEKQSTVFF